MPTYHGYVGGKSSGAAVNSGWPLTGTTRAPPDSEDEDNANSTRGNPPAVMSNPRVDELTSNRLMYLPTSLGP